MRSEAVRDAILRHVRYSLGHRVEELSPTEWFRAVALAARERLIDGRLASEERVERADAKRVAYLSMEFLVGRLLGETLTNLGLGEICRAVEAELGGDLEATLAAEPDAALGNGGLGRLAACFMESLATLDLPAIGYGIHYEFGLFRQELDNGRQRERPDNWLAFGTPWTIERPDEACAIPVYGRVEGSLDRRGGFNPLWLDWQLLVGVPHDLLVAGYGGRTVNPIRLFAARASTEFDMAIFNDGDYLRAVEQKMASETVSKVLYPTDSTETGRELRLVQEYFLVACALRDLMRRFLARRPESFDRFPEKVAIQLNDTHPALAVVELMRLLVDEQAVPWERAWAITVATCAYTNHTLMAEALERWPVALLEKVIPRHLQILYEINRRFLDQVAEVHPGDTACLRRMSLVEEGEVKQVRMAHLAIVGSHSVNGVAALHSELVRTTLVPDFAQLWPQRFNNKTNGVSPRRWLLTANPELAALLTGVVGEGWIRDLAALRALESHVDDAGLRADLAAVKRRNKQRLARQVAELTGVVLDPDSLFDIQVKRIHEYKRQLLNLLYLVQVYLELAEDGRPPAVGRTWLLAGKAAPGYWAAKQIIWLANSIATTVNADRRVGPWLRAVFVPDYRVSLAERIIPAGDLSEQISTAGTEASGTSNMKFALNGALTIGTRDGANIELAEEIGEEEMFLFGLSAAEVAGTRRAGSREAAARAATDPGLARVLAALADGRFTPADRGAFGWLVERLLGGDPYLHLADYAAYRQAQERAAARYGDPSAWGRSTLRTISRVGAFSSDRTIRQYAEEIWHVVAC